MNPTIIAIVGNSGTGKTSLANYLHRALGIPVIVSYTTRKQRENEKHGRDYFFITQEQIPPHEQMLTYTRYGGNQYFALLEQVPKMGRCIYVLDEKGLVTLQQTYEGRFHIASVLIRSTPETLAARGISPERIRRDSERLVLPEEFYDAVIDNDHGQQEFFEESLHIIKQLG